MFYFVTGEGYQNLLKEKERLQKELKQLREEKNEAPKEEGFSEKEQFVQEMEDLQSKLNKIQGKICSAKVVSNSGKKDEVGIGSVVLLESLENGAKKTKTYEITDSECVNPNNGRISYKCPLAQSLLGKREGDICRYSVYTNDGKKLTEVKIIKIG